MREDRERLAANIHWKKKQRVDREDKPNRQVMSEALDLYFGDEEGELDEKIEEKDEVIADIESTVEDALDRLEEAKEERSELVDQKAKIEEQKQDYNDWLDNLLNQRENGDAPYLIPDVIRNRDGFGDYRESAEKVQQDLMERAREQKRHLRKSEFEQGNESRPGEPFLYEQTEEGDEGSEATDQEGRVAYGGGTADD